MGKQINLTLSDEEYDLLQTSAINKNMSVEEYLHYLLFPIMPEKQYNTTLLS